MSKVETKRICITIPIESYNFLCRKGTPHDTLRGMIQEAHYKESIKGVPHE